MIILLSSIMSGTHRIELGKLIFKCFYINIRNYAGNLPAHVNKCATYIGNTEAFGFAWLQLNPIPSLGLNIHNQVGAVFLFFFYL